MSYRYDGSTFYICVDMLPSPVANLINALPLQITALASYHYSQSYL